MKKGYYIIGITLILLLLFIVGFEYYGKYAYSLHTCSPFNIDNIELRTGVDVPSILDSKCQIEKNIKEAWFWIDTSRVDLKKYIIKNGFSPVGNLYNKGGQTKDTRWLAFFNPKTAILSFRIEYLD